MMVCRLSRTLLAGGVLFLVACATNMHPIGMEIVGSAPVLTGALTIGSGARDVTLTSDDGQLACNGVSLLEYAMPACAASGSLRLQCTDGREVTGSWKMDDCTSGRGGGVDSLGNAVKFHVGAGSVKDDAMVVPAPAVATAPRAKSPPGRFEQGAGSHLFRIGGDYATGFGGSQQFAYDAVFADAESGLVILRLAAKDDLPMVLADEPLQAGQEAFVVMVSEVVRIERIRIEGGSPRWKIGGEISLPAGLPVMNAEGQVIALTNGTNLVAAQSLRRYLRIVAPALAEQRGTQATVEQLRARIMARHAD